MTIVSGGIIANFVLFMAFFRGTIFPVTALKEFMETPVSDITARSYWDTGSRQGKWAEAICFLVLQVEVTDLRFKSVIIHFRGHGLSSSFPEERMVERLMIAPLP